MLCPLTDDCNFKRKYESSKNIQCRGFIRIYCIGGRHGECKVRHYYRQEGEFPQADFMPNGYICRD